MTDAEKKKASRAAEKAKREANNLKRSQDKIAIMELQTNLLEVVKILHPIP